MILRNYQRDAVRLLRDGLAASRRDLLLESPVGSGKTSEVKALAADLLGAGHRLIVVLVPQNLLKEQWSSSGEYEIDGGTVRLQGGRVIERIADLTPAFWRTATGFVVATMQKLARVVPTLDGLPAGALDGVLVVADEGHHYAADNEAGKALAAVRSREGTTLLVSATPWSTAGEITRADTLAHRTSPAAYVCSFEADDPAQPPVHWEVARVLVGRAVNDAEATIDRSGSGPAARVSATPAKSEEARARAMCKAIAARWAKDGFPRVVINVPRQFWREPLLRALRAAWKAGAKPGKPDVLDLVGELTDAERSAAQARLRADSAAGLWADIKIDAVISCARMNEGVDWVPCSHVYNAGIPKVAGLILQRWGRASRAKRRIKGYPKKWQDTQTLVFFTPPVTAKGVDGAWKAHRESSWLLAGYLADYEHASEWTQERQRRGLSAALPVPEPTPAAMRLAAGLAEETQRRGGEMSETDARAWLGKNGERVAGQPITPADIDTAVRRLQMADKRHRAAEERRADIAAGIEIRHDRRPDAEPLVEEFAAPIVISKKHAEVALRFTAMDARQVAEKMSCWSKGPWRSMVLQDAVLFAKGAAVAFEARTGEPPNTSPAVDHRCPELHNHTWGAVAAYFREHGLTLDEVLDRSCKLPRDMAALRTFVLERAGEHKRQTGKLPSKVSGILAEYPPLTWSTIESALRKHGLSISKILRPDKVRLSASEWMKRISSFVDTFERDPSSASVDADEAALGTHLCMYRKNKRWHEALSALGLALKADRVAALRHGHGRRQFQRLSELVVLCAQNWGVPLNELYGDEPGHLLAGALKLVERHPSRTRGLGQTIDRAQVRNMTRLWLEVAADCWRLWLEGADQPDPRPWADILAAGDTKRVVKAERTHYLDWAKPGKDGKPVKRVFKGGATS